MKDGYVYIKEYFSDGNEKFLEKKRKSKRYDIEYRVIDFWQCETIENKEFYYLLFEGNYLNGKVK